MTLENVLDKGRTFISPVLYPVNKKPQESKRTNKQIPFSIGGEKGLCFEMCWGLGCHFREDRCVFWLVADEYTRAVAVEEKGLSTGNREGLDLLYVARSN